jgi:hypothetical protein
VPNITFVDYYPFRANVITSVESFQSASTNYYAAGALSSTAVIVFPAR